MANRSPLGAKAKSNELRVPSAKMYPALRKGVGVIRENEIRGARGQRNLRSQRDFAGVGEQAADILHLAMIGSRTAVDINPVPIRTGDDPVKHVVQKAVRLRG